MQNIIKYNLTITPEIYTPLKNINGDNLARTEQLLFFAIMMNAPLPPSLPQHLIDIAATGLMILGASLVGAEAYKDPTENTTLEIMIPEELTRIDADGGKALVSLGQALVNNIEDVRARIAPKQLLMALHMGIHIMHATHKALTVQNN